MIRLGIVGVGDMGSKYAEKIFTHDELGFKITACTRVKGKNLERIKQYMTDDIFLKVLIIKNLKLMPF